MNTVTLGTGYTRRPYERSRAQPSLGYPTSVIAFQGTVPQATKGPPKASGLKNIVLLITAFLGLFPTLPGYTAWAKPAARGTDNTETNNRVLEPLPEALRLQCEDILQKRLKRYNLKLSKKDELSPDDTKTFFLGRTKKITKPEAYLNDFFTPLAENRPDAKGVAHSTLLQQIYRLNQNQDTELSEAEVVQNAIGPAALQSLENEAQRIRFKDLEGLRKRMNGSFCANFDEDMTYNLSLGADTHDVRMLNAIHAAYNLALVKNIAEAPDQDRVSEFLLRFFTETGYMPIPKKFDAKKNILDVQQQSISSITGDKQAKTYTVITERIKYDIATMNIVERKTLGKPTQHTLYELSLFKQDQTALENYLKPKVQEALTAAQNQDHFKALRKDLGHTLYQTRTSGDALNLGQLSLQSLLAPILEDFKRSLGLDPKKHKFLIETQSSDGDFMRYRCSDENIRLYLPELMGQYNHLLIEGYSEDEMAAIFSQQLVESMAHEATHAFVMALLNRYRNDPKAVEADPNLSRFIPALKEFDFNCYHYNPAASSRLLKTLSYHTQQPLEKIAYTLQAHAAEIYRNTYLEPQAPKKP